MPSSKEGIPIPGILIEIQPAYALGGDSDDPIAIVETQGPDGTSDGWYPLNNAALHPGDNIIITPITTPVGKGSITTYRLAPATSPEQVRP